LQDGSYNDRLLCSKWSQLNVEPGIANCIHRKWTEKVVKIVRIPSACPTSSKCKKLTLFFISSVVGYVTRAICRSGTPVETRVKGLRLSVEAGRIVRPPCISRVNPVTLSTTNHMWADLDANRRLHNEKRVTSRLSYSVMKCFK
jgi:hypothetical protein